MKIFDFQNLNKIIYCQLIVGHFYNIAKSNDLCSTTKSQFYVKYLLVMERMKLTVQNRIVNRQGASSGSGGMETLASTQNA